jgi:hypothetical protein
MYKTLSPTDREALKEIARGSLRASTPKATTDRLMSLGLISQKLGGFQLTAEGQMKLGDRS